LDPDREAGGNNAAASQAFLQIPVSAEASHFPGEHQPVILSPNPPLSLWSHPKFQQNEGAKDSIWIPYSLASLLHVIELPNSPMANRRMKALISSFYVQFFVMMNRNRKKWSHV
jgi:hypothetical protein